MFRSILSLLLFFTSLSTTLNAITPIGTLTEITGSPFTAGVTPAWVAYSPIVSGNVFAAIANFNNQNPGNISVYSVNQNTGAFTEVPGSPFAGVSQAGPALLAFSPLVSGGLFAAVANYGSNNVSVFNVNQDTGAFTEISGSPFAAGEQAQGIAYSPIVNGNLFAATANTTDGTVSVYSVDQNTGAFTQVPGSPFTTGPLRRVQFESNVMNSSGGPTNITFSSIASGNIFAMVSNNGSNNVMVYSVDQNTGFFTPVPNAPFATGLEPYGVAFSPILSDNLFAAVTNNGDNVDGGYGTVSVYQVDQVTGVFTPITGSPFKTSLYAGGSQPNAIAYCLAHGNALAIVTNWAPANISIYNVDMTTGMFTEVPGSPYSCGTQPDGIAFSPVLGNNLFAATANYGSNNTNVYQVTICETYPFVAQKVFCFNGTQLVFGYRGTTKVLLQNIGGQIVETTLAIGANSDTYVGAITPDEFNTMVNESCPC